MPTAFLQTTRALNADHFTRYILALGIGLLLLLVWLAWLLLAQVAIYQTSVQGHVQLTTAGSPLSLNQSGVIKTVYAALGSQVKAGEPLLALDHAHVDSAVEQNQAVLQDLLRQKEALEREKQALVSQHEQQLIAQEQQITQLKNRKKLATQTVTLQSQLAQKYQDLKRVQKGSELDWLKAKKALVNAKLNQSLADSLLQQATIQQAQLPNQQQQVLSAMEQNMAKFDAQINLQNERLIELQVTKARHIVRAPIDGSLAAFAQLQPGKFVGRGDTLGTVIPTAEYRVEGLFRPEDALGHIQIGQSATVRIVGAPWTQYGEIKAQVSQVAGAVQEQHIRVQLQLLTPLPQSIELVHDLPVSIEVATEQLTPMALLLRTGGVWLNQSTTKGVH